MKGIVATIVLALLLFASEATPRKTYLPDGPLDGVWVLHLGYGFEGFVLVRAQSAFIDIKSTGSATCCDDVCLDFERYANVNLDEKALDTGFAAEVDPHIRGELKNGRLAIYVEFESCSFLTWGDRID